MSSTAKEVDTQISQVSVLQPPVPETGCTALWTRLYGESSSLAIANAARAASRPLLIITPDMQAAEQLQGELGFFTGSPALPLLVFPDWETLPYDTFSPHQDIISQRLLALSRLPDMQEGITIVPVTTLLQRLPPVEYLQRHSLMLDTGASLELDAMRGRLERAGYQCVSQVMEHGEFAVRGSLLDLFPMGSTLPYRIDLLDQEIDTIRTFDPDTQRSIDRIESIRLLPARECPMDKASISRFRQAFRATFEGDPSASTIYRDVSNGLAPAGIEYYLPLFFERTATLFDYLPASTLVVELDDIDAAVADFREQAGERHESRRHDRERPVLPPGDLFLDQDELTGGITDHTRIRIQRFRQPELAPGTVTYATRTPGELKIRARREQPASALQAFLADFPGRVLITAESTGRRESLRDLLRDFDIHPTVVEGWKDFVHSDLRLGLSVAPLDKGMILDDPPLAVITETQLLGERAIQSRARKPVRDTGSIIRNLTDLHIGAPVVHEDHGVGRYLGLRKLELNQVETEFLMLEYSGGDKLYVPVSSLQLISRYTGASPESAPLHKLGSEQWQRARRKAAGRIHDVAAELLDIYARREARKGQVFPVDHEEYATFSTAFPFEETPDQQLSIDAIIDDMSSTRPMDRVVCGDVGFGKTEVAMRAAFVAANNGHQVAVLVPTTLLAQQHYQNFLDRFADWPIRIEVLSRFRSAKEQQAVVESLASGAVDIVIGTHKLIQGTIRFKNLGLIIVDEEHRFGVRQKEKLKALRAEVDMLTLTATPIPRTLNMSLSGLRDLSIISTPPAHRLAVKTFVSEWDDSMIREACLREIKRGGQVYFLHNEVESIERIARDLEKIVPEASIVIAHGQMRERELEHVMLDFYHRRFNVLLCTTIIESGIDVPSANTILINRADKLGLAQLHQLRGRVGRSHHRAFAYLIVPSRRNMTEDAVKRLEAIASMEELGAGFTLATHDLEIRGAGELLGEDQSGQIQEIGFTLYNELLERAVEALKAGRHPELDKPLEHGPEIDLQVPALIPDDYLPDVHSRLVLYKRIASAASNEDLKDLQIEMIDRFGLLPDPVRNLFRITELKLLAAPMGIRKIESGEQSGRLLFGPDPAVNPDNIITMMQAHPERYRFEGKDKLRFSGEFTTEEERFSIVSSVLHALQ